MYEITKVKDGVILEAAFAGGCSGNTQGICIDFETFNERPSRREMDSLRAWLDINRPAYAKDHVTICN